MISRLAAGEERAAYYRQQASEALERANASRNDSAREGWLRLAEQWTTLAQYALESMSKHEH